jgi:NAD-dependent deacetylase
LQNALIMDTLVILSGAGISAESGIQTFRDSGGLWEGHRVEDVASPEGFKKNPQLVLDFYNIRRNNVVHAIPNKAHETITSLQQHYNVKVITQNIDDLHERAGNTFVTHLHGEITKCQDVHYGDITYPYDKDLRVGDLSPKGYQLRPFIVWFGEAVPKLYEAIEIVKQADVLVVVGTSLQVYPAASLVNYTKPHCKCFIIDKHIPNRSGIGNFTAIEETASVGMRQLFEQLVKP